jgi:hypothetical protein
MLSVRMKLLNSIVSEQLDSVIVWRRFSIMRMQFQVCWTQYSLNLEEEK